MTSYTGKKDFVTFLFYGLGFLLLWEWIRPLERLTDTGNIGIFISFIALNLFLSFINVRLWLRFFIQSVYILVALHYLYFDDPFFKFSWLVPFITDLFENVHLVLRAEWANLTNIFRSLLFFILLWIMCYLVRYWLFIKRNIFIFLLMTILYITVLDTFTPYRADWAIVRTILSGFTMMGMLTFYRLIEKEGGKKEVSFTRKWMIPLLTLIALSVAIGFAVPKPTPIWPDPVPFFKSYAQKSGGVKHSGYRSDDSKLGGPFISDHKVLFQAEVDSSHYWKVETKDVYTGKGWVASTSGSNIARLPFTQTDIVPLQSFSKEVEASEESATIINTEPLSYIVYPRGVKRINAKSNGSFEMNPVTEKINFIDETKRKSLKQYALTYDIPVFSAKALMETVEIDSELLNHFTQLPGSLPPRVGELAHEITIGKETWFDKARALENYFDQSEYSYEKVDVMKPGIDDDYVDQFLFVSKQGYCDNFSTSMVVMLRTLGIPSRWVKGYTEGEYKGLAEDSKKIFEITNDYAHSWVEVYFPNVGWVPFEPTKGASNYTQFNFDNDQDANITEPVEMDKIESVPSKMEKSTTEKNVGVWLNIKGNIAKIAKWIMIGCTFFVVGIVAFYKNRARWLPQIYIWRYKRSSDSDEHFPEAYMALLKQLERQGLIRKENQTLRDYAQYVDRYFSSNEMGRLTSCYEHYMYSGKLPKDSWRKLRESWEKLIKMTIA